MIVHARFQGFFPVALKGVGSEGNDRDVLNRAVFARS